MTVHELVLPQLKRHIAARLKDPNSPIIVTGIPREDDLPNILISTGYALFRVPRPIYQMTFQAYLNREPPGSREGFCMNGTRTVDIYQQLQLWEELKRNCQNTAHLTPYLLEVSAYGKGKRPKQLRLLWADPLTIYVDSDILNTVDVRWGELKAADTDKKPVYFQGTNIDAFFLPFYMQSTPLIAHEAALAKAWYEHKTASSQ